MSELSTFIMYMIDLINNFDCEYVKFNIAVLT